MSKVPMEIQNEAIARMRTLGVRLKDIAEALGVSESYICRIFRGNRPITRSIAQKLGWNVKERWE